LSFVKVDKRRYRKCCKVLRKNTAIVVSAERWRDNHIKVSVKDEGIGMSEESMKSIFDKFYRDKVVLRTQAGLGMGLYVAAKIIAAHGGKIWVESEEEVGSTFKCTLPLLISEISSFVWRQVEIPEPIDHQILHL
jgi:signal transduction histidine kinase